MSSARLQRAFGPGQVAGPHADLPERRQRHREEVDRPRLLVQLHGALGQRQRLVVPVADQRDVGLVAAHQCQHVVGAGSRGEVLGLPQRGHRFVGASGLGGHDRQQRVALREAPAVARGVQRGDGLANLFPDDGRVADLAVADAELVVGQADGAGIEREFRLLEGASEERDAARLIAAERREPAVQAPEPGQPRRRDAFAQHVWRAAEHGGRLVHVVPEEPGLGHRTARGQFVVSTEARCRERLGERVERLGAPTVLQRGGGAGHRGLERLGGHGESIAARARRAERARNRQWRDAGRRV